MKKFKLENVWICELSYVYRRPSDNMMVLYESDSQHMLIMKEDVCSRGNVVHIKWRDYLSEQKVYFDLDGKEYYHGTQKGVFNESDIGKIYVVERTPIPTEILTEEEKETQQISAERIKEIHKRLQGISAEKKNKVRNRYNY